MQFNQTNHNDKHNKQNEEELTLDSQELQELSVEDLYELAYETETTIRDVEELQQSLLTYHENICKVIIQKEREEFDAKR